ncbi:hypothetical protein QWJ22_31490 [Streptomyces sp. MA15]|nr:hypothetical protein [Streptomyces sp. MA15]MDN3271917.1 hypothetical protein [Streptomyces sp. MA15]
MAATEAYEEALCTAGFGIRVCRPGVGLAGTGVDGVHGEHQAVATGGGEVGVLAAEIAQAGQQAFPHGLGVVLKVVFSDVVQSSRCRGAGQGVAAEGGNRRGGERSPVVAVREGNDVIAVGVAGGRQECRVVGLGAGAHEKDGRIVGAGLRGKVFGQAHLGVDEVQGRCVGDAGVEPAVQGPAEFLEAVAEGVGEDAGEEVEVPVALLVGDAATRRVFRVQRFPVVGGGPAGHDTAVPVVQLVS